MTASNQKYEEFGLIEDFPGWDKATVLLKEFITQKRFSHVADIGGGANPLIDDEFLTKHAIDYSLIDISASELEKAPAKYNKICVDVTASSDVFVAATAGKRFDLVFSHMFLEHIEKPEALHRNVFAALKPGGLAVHFFPSANILPLALNGMLPESVSRLLVKVAQPTRDLSGHEAKFPAFYKMCGAPSAKTASFFGDMGYTVVRHTGYVGHSYYERFPILRDLEKGMRPLAVKYRIPSISSVLLVLQKPE